MNRETSNIATTPSHGALAQPADLTTSRERSTDQGDHDGSSSDVFPAHVNAESIGGHIPVLDGVRGFAILIVILFHSTLLPLDHTIHDYFFRIVKLGWSGVDLFFVLSGFLITGILFDAKGRNKYFKTFYGRRLVRIFPLYYAFLIAAFFVIPQVMKVDANVRDHGWWYWAYLSNFLYWHDATATPGPMLITWSLAIEEQFYMLWPLVVFFSPKRVLLAICITVIPGAAIVRMIMLDSGLESGIVYHATFCRLDALACGGLLALLIRSRGGAGALVRFAAPLAVITAIGIVVLYVWRPADPQTQEALQNAQTVVGFSCMALFWVSVMSLLLACQPATRIHQIVKCKPLRMLGKYSYAMYLFHLPIRDAVFEHLWDYDSVAAFPFPIGGCIIMWALVLVPSLAAAMVSWHLFEKQVLKFKKHFNYGRPATA